MTPAYDTFVSPAKWRIVISALALAAIIGAVTAVALLLGAGDPPHAPKLVLNLDSAASLTPAGSFDDAQLFALPVDLIPPFTIEMEASNSGATGSAWGVWLRVSDHYGNLRDLPMLIDNQGYAVAALTTSDLQHQESIHIQPGGNRLYLHVDPTGTAVFRINDEIFATVPLPVTTVEAAGLALYGDTGLRWKTIQIYTGA